MLQKKILILTASPDDKAKLRADKEIKAIEEELDRSKNRDKFKIISKLAVKPDDLIRVLQEEEAEIVHFCGHGTTTGLVFENESGEAQTVRAEALAKLFERFKNKVKCVLLNACYTDIQAKAINQHIEYVIGMTEQVEDTAAIKFAVNFYATLIAGRSYEDAYEFGRIALDLLGIQDDLLPVFLKKSPTNSSEQHPEPPSLLHYNSVTNAFKAGRVIPFLGSGINLFDGLSKIELADYLARDLGDQDLGMANLYQDLVGAPCPVCLLSFKELPPDCPVKKALLEGEPTPCPLNEHALAIAQLNLQWLAQYAKLTFSIQDFYKRLHQFFRERDNPNELHLFFAHLLREMQAKGYPLPYKLLVTTNYDDLLERAFIKANQPFDLVFYVAEGKETQGRFQYKTYEEFRHKTHEESGRPITSAQEVLKCDRPVILKLYGAVKNFVITEDHHLNYLVYRDIEQLLPKDLLEILWESHNILFMGFSPNDTNLRLIVNRLWGERAIGQKSWMIHQSQPGELDKDFWMKHNVDLGYSDLKEYLTKLKQKIEALRTREAHPSYYGNWGTTT